MKLRTQPRLRKDVPRVLHVCIKATRALHLGELRVMLHLVRQVPGKRKEEGRLYKPILVLLCYDKEEEEEEEEGRKHVQLRERLHAGVAVEPALDELDPLPPVHTGQRTELERRVVGLDLKWIPKETGD